MHVAERLLAEVVPSERVGGEEAVVADVPGGGVSEAVGVVQDGDADGLAFDRPGGVAPGRCLAQAAWSVTPLALVILPPCLRSTSMLDATRRPNIPSLVSPKVMGPASALIVTETHEAISERRSERRRGFRQSRPPPARPVASDNPPEADPGAKVSRTPGDRWSLFLGGTVTATRPPVDSR